MPKLNGQSIDTKQMEEMRVQVVEQELSARSWKAYYEKMYYSMEAEKLEEPYKEYKKRLAARIDAERKQMEEFIKTMQDQVGDINAANPDGDLDIKPTVVNISNNG